MVYQYFVKFSYVCADENVFGCTLADSVVLDTADTVVTTADAIGAANDYLVNQFINFIPKSILIHSIEDLRSEQDKFRTAKNSYLDGFADSTPETLIGDYNTWSSGMTLNVVSVFPYYNPIDRYKINFLVLSCDV